jgi:predicted nuclease of predicted toxin-antitoxin system
MKFVADESVDREVLESLRRSGHDVAYIAELDPSLSDEDVLSAAHAAGAILITADKDFGELITYGPDPLFSSKGPSHRCSYVANQ